MKNVVLNIQKKKMFFFFAILASCLFLAFSGGAKEAKAAISVNNSKVSMTLGKTSYIYDGTAKTPSVTVKYNSKKLTKGTDYTLKYTDNKAAGTGKATITGKGSYTGTRSKTFTIKQRAISQATVTLSGTSFTYTGSQVKPSVSSVVYNSKTIGTSNYDVTYGTNVAAGTGTVKLSGKKNFKGTVTKSFTINKASISSASVTLSSYSYTYTGSAITPAPTVVVSSRTLTNGTDYTVSYKNNVNVGTATATITAKTNYSGTRTVNFTIAQKSISGGKMTLSKTTVIYDGTAKTPSATVVVGGKTLTKGEDYSMTYKNNTNAGTAVAMATGIGNYKDSLIETFTIKKQASQIITVSGAKNLVIKKSYTANKKTKTIKKKKTFTINASAKGGAKLTFKKTSGSSAITVTSGGKATVKKGTKKGTYTAKVKISAKATTAYKSTTKYVTLRVTVK